MDNVGHVVPRFGWMSDAIQEIAAASITGLPHPIIGPHHRAPSPGPITGPHYRAPSPAKCPAALRDAFGSSRAGDYRRSHRALFTRDFWRATATSLHLLRAQRRLMPAMRSACSPPGDRQDAWGFGGRRPRRCQEGKPRAQRGLCRIAIPLAPRRATRRKRGSGERSRLAMGHCYRP
jgi:hypothetical protein